MQRWARNARPTSPRCLTSPRSHSLRSHIRFKIGAPRLRFTQTTVFGDFDYGAWFVLKLTRPFVKVGQNGCCSSPFACCRLVTLRVLSSLVRTAKVTSFESGEAGEKGRTKQDRTGQDEREQDRTGQDKT